MSPGIDKLVLLSDDISESFHELARENGINKGGYAHVLDLSQTHQKLPVILHCDGLHNGVHNIDFVRVARLGRRRTLQILRTIVGHLSKARIYRIDCCVDLLGVSVWDLAEACSISRTQNYRLYRSRGGVTLYLQHSQHQKIVLYDKVKQPAAKCSPWVRMFQPDDQLTRIEVQLSGPSVPFRKVRHLYRYSELDLLAHVKFGQLNKLPGDAKPLHRLAMEGLRHSIRRYGLQATKKRFSPAGGIHRRTLPTNCRNGETTGSSRPYEKEHRGLARRPNPVPSPAI